jgi:superfamily I DNA/RNA helicase
LQQALRAILLRLLTTEHIPAGEVVVLTPSSRKKSQVMPQTIADKVELRWHAENEHIQVETIHSFKGLERSVVVLVEIERWLTQSARASDLEKLLYVGCSRACHYLIVLLPKQVPKTLHALFEMEAPALVTDDIR